MTATATETTTARQDHPRGGTHPLTPVLTEPGVLDFAQHGPRGTASSVMGALARAACHLDDADPMSPGGLRDSVTSALALTMSWIVGLDTDTPTDQDWEDLAGQIRNGFATAVRAGDDRVTLDSECPAGRRLGWAAEAIIVAADVSTSDCKGVAVMEERTALLTAATVLAVWATDTAEKAQQLEAVDVIARRVIFDSAIEKSRGAWELHPDICWGDWKMVEAQVLSILDGILPSDGEYDEAARFLSAR